MWVMLDSGQVQVGPSLLLLSSASGWFGLAVLEQRLGLDLPIVLPNLSKIHLK